MYYDIQDVFACNIILYHVSGIHHIYYLVALIWCLDVCCTYNLLYDIITYFTFHLYLTICTMYCLENDSCHWYLTIITMYCLKTDSCHWYLTIITMYCLKNDSCHWYLTIFTMYCLKTDSCHWYLTIITMYCLKNDSCHWYLTIITMYCLKNDSCHWYLTIITTYCLKTDSCHWYLTLFTMYCLENDSCHWNDCSHLRWVTMCSLHEYFLPGSPLTQQSVSTVMFTGFVTVFPFTMFVLAASVTKFDNAFISIPSTLLQYICLFGQLFYCEIKPRFLWYQNKCLSHLLLLFVQ